MKDLLLLFSLSHFPATTFITHWVQLVETAANLSIRWRIQKICTQVGQKRRLHYHYIFHEVFSHDLTRFVCWQHLYMDIPKVQVAHGHITYGPYNKCFNLINYDLM